MTLMPTGRLRLEGKVAIITGARLQRAWTRHGQGGIDSVCPRGSEGAAG